MNCRFTAVDARQSSVMRSLVITDGVTRAGLRNEIHWALHHCPGEGSGESS